MLLLVRDLDILLLFQLYLKVLRRPSNIIRHPSTSSGIEERTIPPLGRHRNIIGRGLRHQTLRHGRAGWLVLGFDPRIRLVKIHYICRNCLFLDDAWLIILVLLRRYFRLSLRSLLLLLQNYRLHLWFILQYDFVYLLINFFFLELLGYLVSTRRW